MPFKLPHLLLSLEQLGFHLPQLLLQFFVLLLQFFVIIFQLLVLLEGEVSLRPRVNEGRVHALCHDDTGGGGGNSRRSDATVWEARRDREYGVHL